MLFSYLVYSGLEGEGRSKCYIKKKKNFLILQSFSKTETICELGE